MKPKSKKKKIIISLVALVLVAAIGAGTWLAVAAKPEPVNVYPFAYIGMTEYWGDSRESYGPVTTDKIQTVYVSTTQTVTEILVEPGDTVKKGDLLMTFDTTLSDLALERERLEVEKLKLQLQDEQERLREIRNMKPMVIPDFSAGGSDQDSNQGAALGAAYRISSVSRYDGSTKELALICWLGSTTTIDDALLENLRLQAESFQNANAQKQPSSASALPADADGAGTEGTTEGTTEATDATDASSETTQSTEGTQPVEPPPYVPFEVNQFYVIFKVTAGDMSLGTRLIWQGVKVSRTGAGEFSFQFFDAYGISDHTLAAENADDTQMPQIDFGSGFTAAQIAELRAEQEKKIKQLEFDIKMAEADYKIMLTEVEDGNIYAQIDGEVVSVLSEEEAKQTMQPIIKVSGGGGFYVEGSISELEKDEMQIGQEVTVNDWNTGMVYTGTVCALGDFPRTDDYWNGMGNPNASYYPFTVFVDGSADLQAGSYVSVMYASSTSQNGIYLQNPFLRTERGRSYVYVQGQDGKLEKRYVTVGKSLWGSYTEILDGLTAEDLIAFPYGKTVKEGAPAVESDISSLYEY